MAARDTSPSTRRPSIKAQKILYQQHYNWWTRVPPYEPPPPSWARSADAVRRVRSGLLYLVGAAIQDVAYAQHSNVYDALLKTARKPDVESFHTILRVACWCDDREFYRQNFHAILTKTLTRERFSCLRRFLAIPVGDTAPPIKIERDKQLFAVAAALLHAFRHTPPHIHTAIGDAIAQHLDHRDMTALTPAAKGANDAAAAAASSSSARLPEWAVCTIAMDRVRTGLLSMIHVEIEALKRLCFACRRGSLEGRGHACEHTPADVDFYEHHLDHFTMILLSPSRLSRLREFLATAPVVCAIDDETLFAVAVALLHEFTHSPTLVRDLAAAAQATLAPDALPPSSPSASPYTAEEIAMAEEIVLREEAKRRGAKILRLYEMRLR